jgi:hypothetical protein
MISGIELRLKLGVTSLYRKFLNARSPLRLLEKGLHGGLGPGNIGIFLSGHGLGKGSVLVGVALDELLRSGNVLHVSLDHPVAHVRAHYDTVYEDLAATTHLEDPNNIHEEINRRRSIRVYPANAFSGSKLREAVKLETEAGKKPSLVVIEGEDFDSVQREDFEDFKALAEELAAEIWLSAQCSNESEIGVPASIARLGDLISVIVALEPHNGSVVLRALKDHENADLADLHVALDPRTLLLKRN